MSDFDIFSIPQYKVGGLVKAQKQLDALKKEKQSMLQLSTNKELKNQMSPHP